MIERGISKLPSLSWNVMDSLSLTSIFPACLYKGLPIGCDACALSHLDFLPIVSSSSSNTHNAWTQGAFVGDFFLTRDTLMEHRATPWVAWP